MAENLARAVPEISSEPLYIALSLGGIDDAYDLVRRLAETARLQNKDLLDVARADDKLRAILDGLPDQTGRILADPSQYVGHASVIAKATATKSREHLHQLADRLKEIDRDSDKTA